jgi:hypothetical protein
MFIIECMSVHNYIKCIQHMEIIFQSWQAECVDTHKIHLA